ncbi:nucleotidyltransferase domain-containing protein, partial [Clostridium sp.]|uniref:nucleotidyltransferase domain-containing protein n=1 Tax=Clostridium sp. TaxID=1506 RepID=UPI003F3A5B21
MKDKIIKYLLTKYDPHTIILYGSYANGTNNLNSDFDALIITDKQFSAHDATEIDGVLLDVFIYNTSSFGNEINFNEYVQIHDGCIVLDKYETGKYLKENVCKLIKETPKKSNEEKLQQIKWCEKMLSRI